MPRLIHLNGAPGVGKTTVARRFAADHPGTLLLDIDLLRTLVGGWTDDYARAGGLIRPVALAAIKAYLDQGEDVVLPQLIARPEELARFRRAAGAADYHHLVLTAPADVLVRRFGARATSGGPEDTAGAAARHVAEHGGGAVLRSFCDDLYRLVAKDPESRLVETVDGDVEATYAAIRAVLARG